MKLIFANAHLIIKHLTNMDAHNTRYWYRFETPRLVTVTLFAHWYKKTIKCSLTVAKLAAAVTCNINVHAVSISIWWLAAQFHYDSIVWLIECVGRVGVSDRQTHAATCSSFLGLQQKILFNDCKQCKQFYILPILHLSYTYDNFVYFVIRYSLNSVINILWISLKSLLVKWSEN